MALGSAGGISPGLGNILGGVGSISSTISQTQRGQSGIDNIRTGGALQQQGLAIQASSFRSGGQSAVNAATYNTQLTAVNFIREREFIGRQIASVASSQRAQAASTGISVTSGSTLAVMDATLNDFTRKLIHTKQNAEFKINKQRFEGQVALAESENRARAAEHQGAIARFQAESSASEQQTRLDQNLFSGVATGFQTILGGFS